MSDKTFDHKLDWYYEGNVGKVLAKHLASRGYTIEKDNSENCRARGVDLIAVDRNGTREMIEIKGYPSERHTKGFNKGDRKKTKPPQQAAHWFNEVIMTCVLNFGRYQDQQVEHAFALPDLPRYHQLVAKVLPFFKAYNIPFKVYLIREDGTVSSGTLFKTSVKKIQL